MLKYLLKTLLLAVLMLSGTVSYAQDVLASDFNIQMPASTTGYCDSLQNDEWNSTSSMWETSDYQKANLTSNNYLESLLFYNGTTKLLEFGMHFTRDANNRATKLEVKYSGFVAGEYTATYDANGLLTEQIGKQLNQQTFQLENADRLVPSYDVNDNMIELMQYAWDGTQWVDDYKYTYTYNTSNQRTAYIAEFYDNGSYGNETRVTYTYTTSGEIETETEEFWNGSSWVNEGRETYVYNTSDEKIYSLLEDWSGSAWTNRELDSAISLTESITYEWDGSAWQLLERTICAGGSMPNNPPTDPNTLFASAAGSTEVNMSWDHFDNTEDGFVVQRSDDGTNWATIDSTGVDEISYKDVTVSAGNDYYYRVAAYNQYGLSGWSNVSTVTTPLTPVAPSNLAAASISESAIELTWNENANDELGTVIERSFNGTSGWTLVDTIAADATDYTDTALASATTHYYRVYVYNVNGVSGYSNVASATTMSTVPAQPTNLQITITGKKAGKKAQLTWDDNSVNETGFYIYRSMDSTVFNLVDSTDANIASYLDSTISEGSTYFYYVTAYNGMGESQASNTEKVDVPVGIEEANNTLVTTVYPNPTVNSVVLRFTNEVSSQVQVRVFDLTGKAVITENVSLQGNMHTVDVSSLASGNYVIEVRTENMNYTGKIIKK